MNRRDFIQSLAGVIAAGSMLNACKEQTIIPGKIIGASSKAGHLARDGNFKHPEKFEIKDIVIVGGGISGLSAARWLNKKSDRSVSILELESSPGGNAASGMNAVSAFPWGAHYIPVPNNDLPEYLDFLKSAEVIKTYDSSGLPEYNSYYLCFDPEERLYINGKWQDGLVPDYGLGEEDRNQLQLFLKKMEAYRWAKGEDGKDAFAIPVDRSSLDEKFTALDSMTMKQWLELNQFSSRYLHWFCNYCTRDDFGTKYDEISAWVGIHYFAGRKGKAVNASHADVLTWPEGNGFLVKHLLKEIHAEIITGAVVVQTEIRQDKIRISYVDVKTGISYGIECNQLIMASPQFVNAHILGFPERASLIKQHLHYTPWMLANLRVKNLLDRTEQGISWDNVVFESESLGYVDATHQMLQQETGEKNLTYYLPLTGSDPVNERKKASEISHADWMKIILKDLKPVHPELQKSLQEANIMIWGHAMAQPRPGMIFGDIRKKLSEPINGKVFFAHTDLAGISIFEEGFYQGIKAADQLLSTENA